MYKVHLILAFPHMINLNLSFSYFPYSQIERKICYNNYRKGINPTEAKTDISLKKIVIISS